MGIRSKILFDVLEVQNLQDVAKLIKKTKNENLKYPHQSF